MNGATTFTQIMRFAWKDMRRIGGLWIALLLFWVACLALGLVNSYFSNNFAFPFSRMQMLIGILVTATVYALGWAGLTFASEHDDGTYGFLRALPVQPQQVFYGKLLFGVNSTLLLVLTLAAVCLCHYVIVGSLGGHYSSGAGMRDYETISAVASGLSIPIAIVVGLFWSLQIKKPLLALGVAGLCLPIATQLCLLLSVSLFPNALELGLASKDFGLALAGIVVVGLLFCLGTYWLDWRLAMRWLPDNRLLVADHSIRAEGGQSQAVPISARPSGLWRLLWLAQKQNLGWCVGLAILGVVVAACWPKDQPACLSLLVAGLIGVIAFRPEHQQHRYRLLSQMGVSPGFYWLSGLLMPFVAVTVVAAATLAATDSWSAWSCLNCFVTFLIAQFCSLAFSSTIIAIAASLMASLIACGWTMLCTRLGVPFWLIYGPILLLPLVASFLRVPGWFRDTRNWRQWVIPGVPVAMLLIGTPTATALYRIYEIPSVTVPDGLQLAPLSASQEETVRRYEQAFALIRSEMQELPQQVRSTDLDVIVQALKDSEWRPSKNLRRQLVEATQGAPAFPKLAQVDRTVIDDPSHRAAAVLLLEAQTAQDEDDSQTAWRYYSAALRLAQHRNDGRSGSHGVRVSDELRRSVHSRLVDWSMRDDTSVELIDDAIRALAEDDSVRQSRTQQLAYLAGNFAQTDEWLSNPPRTTLDFPIAFAPWEIVRSRRYRDYEHAMAFDRMDSKIDSSVRGHTYLSSWLTPSRENQSEATDWSVDLLINTLASIGHHKQHGSYPASLAECEMLSELARANLFKFGIVGEGGAAVGSPYLFRADLIANSKIVALNEGWVSIADYQDYSENREANQIYPLPSNADFEEWNVQRFETDAVLRIAKRQQAYESAIVMAANAGQLSGYDGSLEQPSEAESEAELTRSLMFNASSEQLTEVLQTLVRSSLDSEKLNVRLWALEALSESSVLKKFLPEVLDLAHSEDLDRSTFAIHAINRFLRATRPLPSELGELDGQLSRTDLDLQSLAMPIRNPANGHYYELIRSDPTSSSGYGALSIATRPNSWSVARGLANDREFQGMRGYLATVTTSEELEFLRRAFVVPLTTMEQDFGTNAYIWLGGRRSQLTGDWRWASGPEDGQVFYHGHQDVANSLEDNFVPWGDEHPLADSTANSLVWFIPRSPALRTPPTTDAVEAVGLSRWGNPLTLSDVSHSASIESSTVEVGSWLSSEPQIRSNAWYLVEYSPDTETDTDAKDLDGPESSENPETDETE